MDQSKKTMRHFYCRDVLWETFEQMANDFDCSIDYLVNEAMRYYARSKNYQSPGAPNVTGGQQVPNNTSGPVSYPKGGGAGPSGGAMRPQPGTQPPPQPAASVSAGPPSARADQARRPAPPTPGYAPNNSPPSGGGAGASMRNGPNSNHAPAAPASSAPMAQMGSAGPTLFLVYNGQRYPVTKDQFIIGRGSKTSDLPIKDGNISRKHAAVIRRNGTFYIKDLGSTNGIDYKGMRIDNKRIDEGDVFHLCDYELRFTYRAD
ncbi:MAG: FHA domain-containing protein [Deltaproteobacteria bacterium]|nr:FHA domain-containing protein [Deltaproteobacteria bacterium]